MNLSSTSTTFISYRNSTDSPGFRSEKNLSPSKRPVSPLGKRLDDLQTSLTYDKTTDTSEFERKVKTLDETITNNNDSIEGKYRVVIEQVAKAEERIALEVASIEALKERKTHNIEEVESSIVQLLENQSRDTKNSRQRLMLKFEDRVSILTNEVVFEQVKVQEGLDKQYNEIAMKVDGLKEGIQNNSKTRKEGNEKLMNNFSQHIHKIRSTLDIERKVRQETEDILFRSLEDINKKLTNQVQNERETRERCEEQMLKLLEQACEKLETHISRPRKNRWAA